MTFSDKKILIAYYSRNGENFSGGCIVNLPIGNTEVIAKMAHELTGGEIFEIRTTDKYPVDYNETIEVAKDELRKKQRPGLSVHIDNMDEYDTIILGYPNWWGTMPMAVYTFLESYDFSGKTIIPFCTHEGSGMGSSEREIKKLCPDAIVLAGLAVRGSAVAGAEHIVESWLNGL